jgi:hypothetical protein
MARAGHHGNLQRVGGELVQERVPAATTDNVQSIDPALDQLLDLPQRPAVEQRQALQSATDECARR